MCHKFINFTIQRVLPRIDNSTSKLLNRYVDMSIYLTKEYKIK